MRPHHGPGVVAAGRDGALPTWQRDDEPGRLVFVLPPVGVRTLHRGVAESTAEERRSAGARRFPAWSMNPPSRNWLTSAASPTKQPSTRVSQPAGGLVRCSLCSMAPSVPHSRRLGSRIDAHPLAALEGTRQRLALEEEAKGAV